MIETLIAGLIVAAISGLTALAYKDFDLVAEFPYELFCVFSTNDLKRGASVGTDATMIPKLFSTVDHIMRLLESR